MGSAPLASESPAVPSDGNATISRRSARSAKRSVSGYVAPPPKLTAKAVSDLSSCGTRSASLFERNVTAPAPAATYGVHDATGNDARRLAWYARTLGVFRSW